MKYFYIFLSIVYLNTVFSKDYPLAPEIWSEPLRIDSVSIKYSWDEAPALTKNLDTMYLDGPDGIYMSVKLNDIWKRQVKLDKNVNDRLPVQTTFIPVELIQNKYTGNLYLSTSLDDSLFLYTLSSGSAIWEKQEFSIKRNSIKNVLKYSPKNNAIYFGQ